MPPFYRTRQLPVDRNPLSTRLSALPKTGLTNQNFLQSLLDSIKNLYGLDFSSPSALFDSIAEFFEEALAELNTVVSAALQQFAFNFQQLITGVVQNEQATVTDLVAVLKDTTTNATTAAQAIQTLLNDLGLGTIPGLATYLGAIQADANQALTNIAEQQAADQTFVEGIVSAIQNFTSWPSFIAAVQSDWNTWITTTTGLESAETFTVQQLLNSLFGINPSTGGNIDAENALTQLSSLIAGVLNGSSSISDLATFLKNTWTQLTSSWDNWWNGIFGTNVSGKTASDMQTAAGAVSSTANTANTNASNALSQWLSAITASGQASASAFGTFVSNTWSQLTGTWNNFWNGTYGTNVTGKTASDVQTAAASVASTANTASTNASSSLSQWSSYIRGLGGTVVNDAVNFVQNTFTQLGNTWNSIWNGTYGTNVSGKSASDVQTAAAATASVANTANTNAATANSNLFSTLSAFTGSTSVPTASTPITSPLSTASQLPHITIGGVTTDIESHVQNMVDTLNQAQTGGSATGTTISALGTSYTAIPASNIQGQTGATVTYGTTGSVAGSSSSPGTITFTPLSTDTQVDVIVTLYGAQNSTYTITCTYAGASQPQVINQAGNSYGGNTPQIVVFRIPLTPTANPPTMSISISATSGGSSAYWSAVGISYAGVKANYSAGYVGSLSAGSNSISMSRTSSPTRRLFQVVTCIANGTPTFAASSGSAKVNYVGSGSSAKLFVMDQAAASSGTTTLSSTVSLPSGYSGSWAAVLVEISN